MSLALQPEYQQFAYCKVDLIFPISGTNQEISISKIGEKLSSLTIREGTTGEGEQFTDANTLMCASGEVSMYDTDNIIFRAFMASRGDAGNPLQIRLNIEVRTYTGNRSYSGLVDSWSVSFDGGIPKVSVKWKQIGDFQQTPSITIDDLSSKVDSLVNKLSSEGISTLSEFYEVMQSSGLGISIKIQSGSNMVSTSGETINGANAKIKPNFKNGEEKDVFRFNLTNTNNKGELINSIFNGLIQNVELDNGQRLFGTYISSSEGIGSYLLYTSRDAVNNIRPNNGDDKPLNDAVFVYNSSIYQGDSYKTADGSVKTAFLIDDFSCSITDKDIIYVQGGDSNSNNPNGNMVITSKGRVILPTNTSSALREALYNNETAAVSQSLQVKMTTYNFIHFYVFGETLVDIVIFDHMGQVHPLSGKMRVVSYTYSISGGALKADVTLQPVFTNDSSSYFKSSSFVRDAIVDGYGNIIKSQYEDINAIMMPPNVNLSIANNTSTSDINSPTVGGEQAPDMNYSSNYLLPQISDYTPVNSDLSIKNNLSYELKNEDGTPSASSGSSNTPEGSKEILR